MADAGVDPIRVHAGRVLQSECDGERLAGGDGICFCDQSDWDFRGASELSPGGSAAEQDEGDKSGERGDKAVVHESMNAEMNSCGTCRRGGGNGIMTKTSRREKIYRGSEPVSVGSLTGLKMIFMMGW